MYPTFLAFWNHTGLSAQNYPPFDPAISQVRHPGRVQSAAPQQLPSTISGSVVLLWTPSVALSSTSSRMGTNGHSLLPCAPCSLASAASPLPKVGGAVSLCPRCVEMSAFAQVRGVASPGCVCLAQLPLSNRLLQTGWNHFDTAALSCML